MLEQAFINFGYTKEEYNKIRNSYIIIKYNDEKFLQKFKEKTTYLLELGYTKEDIIMMTKNYPSIYGYSIENMKQKLTDLQLLGYSKEEVIKMIKNLPSIYGYSIENMKQKLTDLQLIGYSKEDTIKMTKSFPSIYSYSIENMKQKLTDLQLLGYSKEEVIKMTKSLPSIYSYSIENMKQKLTDLQLLGYSKEDVIKMTKVFPQIYSISIENMKQKIEFYDSINMHFLAVQDPKQLMQSVALSYARYQFYLSISIIVDMNNYKKLFIENKRFEKTYGITKEKLLERYPYEHYLEDKNNGRTI